MVTISYQLIGSDTWRITLNFIYSCVLVQLQYAVHWYSILQQPLQAIVQMMSVTCRALCRLHFL